ncbi:hypothetical protein THASP1DRAFT_22243 [Thamnocephalis sphaerospora]|uniref:Uncharacterized protein n=1 Tax=Thamnocephalis sphaerospora TaxID=78915 RepID=A0A4P9XUT5_9FUNG|nr:hypothetical protein THASP1DRAFT_22243 [Thamnocephalis sphaerospora]|eukprot:RKP09976.1 hypothetical protein THASP1DRAFT_22243 [Thamnocephalis sphaerospora]
MPLLSVQCLRIILLMAVLACVQLTHAHLTATWNSTTLKVPTMDYIMHRTPYYKRDGLAIRWPWAVNSIETLAQIGIAAQRVGSEFQRLGYPSPSLIVVAAFSNSTLPLWGPNTPAYYTATPSIPDGPPVIDVALLDQWASERFHPKLGDVPSVFAFSAVQERGVWNDIYLSAGYTAYIWILFVVCWRAFAVCSLALFLWCWALRVKSAFSRASIVAFLSCLTLHMLLTFSIIIINTYFTLRWPDQKMAPVIYAFVRFVIPFVPLIGLTIFGGFGPKRISELPLGSTVAIGTLLLANYANVNHRWKFPKGTDNAATKQEDLAARNMPIESGSDDANAQGTTARDAFSEVTSPVPAALPHGQQQRNSSAIDAKATDESVCIISDVVWHDKTQ